MSSASTYYVYFVTQPHSGLIKIGFSKNTDKRIKSIVSASGFDTVLLDRWSYGSKFEARAIEAHLHHKYAFFREAGEWFKGIKIPDSKLSIDDIDVNHAPSRWASRVLDKSGLNRPKIAAAIDAGHGPSVLHREHGMSRTTLFRIMNGEPLNYDMAIKLSEIHPEFTAAEYCDESRDRVSGDAT